MQGLISNEKDLEDTEQSFWIYNLVDTDNNYDNIDSFIGCKSTAFDHIKMVLVALNNAGYDFKAPCTLCYNEYNPEYMTLEDSRGAGGLSIVHDSMICEDCLAMYSCSHCAEFFGDDYEDFDDEGHCEYCQITVRENEISSIRQRLTRLEFGNQDHINAIKELKTLETELKELNT